MELSQTECAVCLQKLHHPTKLPCNHIFCFLCVKGVAIQNKKCAMCRAEIPPDYLDNPVFVDEENATHTEVEYQWYYEGRNGWWKYDEHSNDELEAAFAAGETMCTLLLAGSLYCIDFEKLIQTRRNDSSRRRKVRRDTPALPSKGIAGIKIFSETEDKTDDPEVAPSSQSEGPSEPSLPAVCPADTTSPASADTTSPASADTASPASADTTSPALADTSNESGGEEVTVLLGSMNLNSAAESSAENET